MANPHVDVVVQKNLDDGIVEPYIAEHNLPRIIHTGPEMEVMWELYQQWAPPRGRVELGELVALAPSQKHPANFYRLSRVTQKEAEGPVKLSFQPLEVTEEVAFSRRYQGIFHLVTFKGVVTASLVRTMHIPHKEWVEGRMGKGCTRIPSKVHMYLVSLA